MSDNMKTNPYGLFKTESDLEIGGVWQDYGDFRIKLARAGGRNTPYSKLLTKFVERLQNKKRNSPEEGVRIMAEVFARGVIKGMEMKTEDGAWVSGMHLEVHDPELGEKVLKVVEPSVENLMQMLIDLPDFADELRTIANEGNTFKKALEEDMSGN
jgi:hypothetical protein